MVEIPSFFNKLDFFSILLPGYVFVTLYIFLFSPGLIVARPATTTPIQTDLFSIVLLIVAGPVVGGILRAIHRFFYAIKYELSSAKKKERAKRLFEYARIRVFAKPDEVARLDEVDSEYDFRVSTALATASIGIYYFSIHWIPNFQEFVYSLVMLIVGGALFYGGYLIRAQRWEQIYMILNNQVIKSKSCEYVYDDNTHTIKLI